MDALNARRIFSLLVIVVIGFIFAVQWGPASRGCDSTVGQRDEFAIARVNGTEVPVQDFRRIYRARMESARAQQIPESMVRQFLVPQIVDSLVELELWAQAAQRHGVIASDEELRKLLRSTPSFQENGKFSMERYKRLLRDQLQKTVPEYEAQMRKELSAQKMANLVASGAVVSEDEVRSDFQQDGNKVNLTFARFMPSMYADKVPAPSEADVDAWAKSHESEINNYFEANRALYEQPERIRARHILVPVPRDASDAQKDAARARAESIRKEIEGGKDFAQAAQEHSSDTSNKDRGGDLGIKPRTAFVPEFSDAAFALEVGKVSEPVLSQFGYHLIKVDEKLPAETKGVDDVRGEIARTLLLRERAKEMARAEAEKGLSALTSGKGLTTLFPPEGAEPAAKRFETETRPEAVPTGEFTASATSIPLLGAAPRLMTDAFAAQAPKPLGQLYEVGDGYAIAEVTARTLPSDDEFNKQRDTLIAQARQAKAAELQNAFVKSLREQAQIQKNDKAINDLLDAS